MLERQQELTPNITTSPDKQNTKKRFAVLVSVSITVLISLAAFVYFFLITPKFEVVNINKPDGDIPLYENTIIGVDVANRGIKSGEYRVELLVDGQLHSYSTIKLNGKSTNKVLFLLRFSNDEEWGTHTLSINGESFKIYVNEGLSPNVVIGDRTDYEVQAGTDKFNDYETVSGENIVNGRGCWQMSADIFPPIANTFTTGESCFDKETFFPIYTAFSDKYKTFEGSVVGPTAEIRTDFDHLLLDTDSIFPYSVGNSFRVREIETSNTGGAPKETIKRYRLDGVEKITTPAGDFKAFKITITDDKTGELLEEVWQAPKVKLNLIKLIDYSENFSQTLKGYVFPVGPALDDEVLSILAKSRTIYDGSDLRIEFEYPSNWILGKGYYPATISLTIPGTEGRGLEIGGTDVVAGARMDISISTVSYSSLEEYYKNSVYEYPVEKQPIVVDGVDGYEYSFQYEGPKMRIIDFYKNGKKYSFALETEGEETTSEYYVDFKQLVESVKFR